MIPMREPETVVRLDTPAGPITARAQCRDGRCASVEIANVPAFVDRLDATIEVEGLGTVTLDTAYGGMFYVITDATRFGLRRTPDEGADISRITEMVKAAAAEQIPVVHPQNEGDDFRHEGVLGTVFVGRIVAETTVGPYRAIVPTITGTGWITGFAQYVVDPTDPFPDGWTVGDIW